MPSSPKLSHARSYWWSSRRSAVLILCPLVGLSCFVCGLVAVFRVGVGCGCKYGRALSLTVAWDKPSADGRRAVGDVLGDGRKRHKAMGFVGVETEFGSAGRRRALRQTWFPSDRQGHQRLKESTGLVFKFVIGRRISDRSKMAALKKEISEYDDFLLLDVEVGYTNLTILAFFKAAYTLYESDFYVRADDDIYLRPDRLSFLLAKDRSVSRTYLGCMKKGPVFTDPKLKRLDTWLDLLGEEYFIHAYGPVYALSADVVVNLVALKNDSLRVFSNEAITVGSWMLAMNVVHEHSEELCSLKCTPTSIAVWDGPKCPGLCNPEMKMLELHKLDVCSKSSTIPYEPLNEDDDGDNNDDGDNDDDGGGEQDEDY